MPAQHCFTQLLNISRARKKATHSSQSPHSPFFLANSTAADSRRLFSARSIRLHLSSAQIYTVHLRSFTLPTSAGAMTSLDIATLCLVRCLGRPACPVPLVTRLSTFSFLPLVIGQQTDTSTQRRICSRSVIAATSQPITAATLV